MIYKDLDGFDAQDKFRIAGRKAEEQMAFYLRRFFSDSAEVDVLNGLRIELDGEVAQMDHLVLHPFGLLIVESKSVVESIQLEDDGQWVRWYSGRPQGMRSPITQARMQAMLLKALLNQKVKQPGVFDRLQLDVLVAISDQGRIQWPSTGPLLEVCKADQVPDRITQKIKEAAQTNGSAFLHAQNRQRIAQFLGLMHKPLPLSAPTLTPAPATSPAPTPQPVPTPQRGQLPLNTCKHCGSNEVEGRYGQYGYYLACRRCEKNTGLKFTCPACGGEGRVRKAGLEFFAECKSCTASVRFHRN